MNNQPGQLSDQNGLQQVPALQSEIAVLKRELKIEAALEKVRALTLAMQHQDDLLHVTNEILKQFTLLGVDIEVVNFSNGLSYRDWDIWLTTPDAESSFVTLRLFIPWFEHPYFEKTHVALNEYFEKGMDLGTAIFQKAEKDSFLDHALSHTAAKEIFSEEARNYLYSKPGYTWSTVMMKDTWMSICRYSIIAFSDEENNLLRRFATAFSLTYARFLDLQKAEAQARETEIELSLERVRAKTMAMQKPSEFVDVINIIGEQFVHLGFDIDWVNFGANGFEISKGIDIWNFAVIPGASPISARMFIPYFDHPVFTTSATISNEFINGGKDFITVTLDKQTKDTWLDHLFTKTIFKDTPEEHRVIQYAKPGYNTSNISLKDTWLSIGKFDIKHFTDEQHAILRRFAKAFGQSYTRFLDLQKAEAQAREAEIQLALERVRAKTMAMQKQDELLAVLDLLVEQLFKLGVKLEVANFSNGISEADWDLWVHVVFNDSIVYSNYVHYPRIDHLYFDRMDECVQIFQHGGTGLFKDVFSKEEKDSWQHYCLTETIYKDIVPQDVQQLVYDRPGYAWSIILLKETWVAIGRYNTIPFSDEEDALLQRFAQAFSQAYTRFLDLKKAAEQAKEAEIQLALERVRARTMAMQKQDDLLSVLELLVEQFTHLGVQIDVANFSDGLPEGDLDLWVYSVPEGGNINSKYAHFPLIDNPVFDHINKSIERYKNEGFDLSKEVFSKEEKDSFFRHVYTNTIYKDVASEEEKHYVLSASGYAWSVIIMSETWVSISRFSTIPFTNEEDVLLRRFASAFGLAYTRFLDLKKAEEQAREAEIQLALERVRAGTMAMQKQDDLLDVSELLLEQFMKLGVQVNTALFSNGLPLPYEDWYLWILGPVADGTLTKDYVHFPHIDHPYFIRTQIVLEQFRAGGTDLSKEVFAKEDKDSWLDYMYTQTIYKDIVSEEARKYFYDKPGYTWSAILLKDTWMHIGRYDTIPLNEEEDELLRRFADAFGLAYTRFLDLKKAEEQLRESQIQAALERVRSRSMGMQKSEELRDVIQVVYEQLLQLNFVIHNAGFLMDYRESYDYNIWMADVLGEFPTLQHFPYFDHVINGDYIEQKNNGPELFTSLYSFAEKNTWMEVIFKSMSGSTEEGKAVALSSPAMSLTRVLLKNIGLYLINFTETPYTDAENVTLIRFANVFDQTYTRFKDLKQAEEQLRESQIQAALERVRSRSMGMQKSEELRDVGFVIYEQLVQLNFNIAGDGFSVDYNVTDDFNLWSADRWGAAPDKIHLPYIDHPQYNRLKEAKEKGLELYTDCLTREEKNKLWDHYFMCMPWIEQEIKDFIYGSPGMITTMVLLKNVLLYVWSTSDIPFTDAENAILMRFGKVFEQAYTRFNDLKQAEEQLRESQIQASLERVRSRSMGMQKSEELRNVIQVTFEQLVQLNFEISNAGFLLDYRESNDANVWMTSAIAEYPAKQHVPYFDHPFGRDYLEQKKSGAEFFTKIYPFDEKNSFTEGVSKYLPLMTGEAKKIVLSTPALTVSRVLMKNVGLYLFKYDGTSYSDTENAILIRFAKAFEQAYTRFNDLKQAEEQLRESQIQAALERVRSRSMGMQKSEELRDVIKVIYEQIVQLQIKLDAAGFAVDYRDSNDLNLWEINNSYDYPFKVCIPYFDHPIFRLLIEAKEDGVDFYTYQLTIDEKNIWLDNVLTYYPASTSEVKEAVYRMPGIAVSTVLLKNITLYIHNWSCIPFSEEENNTLKRFGKAFEQTYTRFKDLERAETQAMEAIKRASVDRVRAEIASMRTTHDLERIQPLIWNELTTLGVPFIRCGVFIMDEEKQQVQTMLSTPDGKAIATLHVAFDFDLSIIINGVDHWRKKILYKEHWDAAAFTKSWIALSALRDISMESPQAEHPPENLYLHMLPFMQGMLYVGNEAPLNEDALNLVQNLADAFAAAYARYEDFNKLEAANAKIEKTLVDLKQTQAQLVQSEKMASLGELTAGIAHEIQNPLNFVNNFSDLNKELIAELKDELKAGNLEDVEAIATDIESNEGKISHHGKRAQSIVTGMLQHSRSGKGEKQMTDINKLADEYLRLSYHGIRAKDKDFNCDIETSFDETIGQINIIPQEIGRVILNLVNNAFYTVNEKSKQSLEGYKPAITVTTKKQNNHVLISVADNGNGIPDRTKDKIFNPFFTTKPTGQGTGLGLSLSYDIVKAHGGEIKVESKEGEGTSFIIQLPA